MTRRVMNLHARCNQYRNRQIRRIWRSNVRPNPTVPNQPDGSGNQIEDFPTVAFILVTLFVIFSCVLINLG